MFKDNYKVGIKVNYYGKEYHHGTITKLKPIVAVISIIAINGDEEIHEISYHRLQKD